MTIFKQTYSYSQFPNIIYFSLNHVSFIVYSHYGLFCDIILPRGNNGEGNGTPLQYSCLENLMGGGAW